MRYRTPVRAQRFGGRASVIAWLSAGTSLALFLVARRLPDR